MSSAIAPLSEPDDSDAQAADVAGDGCAAPSAERRLRMLDRLAEAGMEMIEALTAQAKGSGPKVVDGDVALAFSRVSRAVRMAVLLQQQLDQGAVVSPMASQEAALKAEAGRKKEHIRRVGRIVARVALDCGKKPERAADFAYAARERLDDDDIYSLVAARPVGELVAMICRDFGLEPDWDALEQEAWAQAEIASGAAGSPFLEDRDEDEDDAEDGEAPEPDPEPQVPRPRTFQDRINAAARDPEIIAAARRDSG
jgi:hypothetical protein